MITVDWFSRALVILRGLADFSRVSAGCWDVEAVTALCSGLLFHSSEPADNPGLFREILASTL